MKNQVALFNIISADQCWVWFQIRGIVMLTVTYGNHKEHMHYAIVNIKVHIGIPLTLAGLSYLR